MIFIVFLLFMNEHKHALRCVDDKHQLAVLRSIKSGAIVPAR